MKNLEDILCKKSEISVKFAMISQERHKDQNLHLHVILSYQRELNIRGDQAKTFFDCLCPGHHANIQNVKSLKDAVEYLKKEDPNPMTMGSLPGVTKSDSNRPSKSDQIALRVADGEKFQTVFEDFPGFCLMNKSKIDSLTNYFKMSKMTKAPSSPWTVIGYDGHSGQTLEIAQWCNLNIHKERAFKQKQLYIYGPPDHLKTSFTMWIGQRLRVYWVSHDDYFDGYDDDSYDLVVFDEFFAKDRDQNRVNNFLDGSPANLVVRYGNVLKTKNLPVIILSNLTLDQQFGKKQYALSAMKARVVEVQLLEGPIDLPNLRFSGDIIEPTKFSEY